MSENENLKYTEDELFAYDLLDKFSGDAKQLKKFIQSLSTEERQYIKDNIDSYYSKNLENLYNSGKYTLAIIAQFKDNPEGFEKFLGSLSDEELKAFEEDLNRSVDVSWGETLKGAGKSAWALLSKGGVGLLRFVEQFIPNIGKLSDIKKEFDNYLNEQNEYYTRQIAEEQGKQALNVEVSGKLGANLKKWTQDVIVNTLNNIPNYALGIITRNPKVALTAFGGQAFFQSLPDDLEQAQKIYGDGWGKIIGNLSAFNKALWEAGTETVAFERLLTNRRLISKIAEFIGVDALGEQVNQIASNVIDKFTLKSIDDVISLNEVIDVFMTTLGSDLILSGGALAYQNYKELGAKKLAEIETEKAKQASEEYKKAMELFKEAIKEGDLGKIQTSLIGIKEAVAKANDIDVANLIEEYFNIEKLHPDAIKNNIAKLKEFLNIDFNKPETIPDWYPKDKDFGKPWVHEELVTLIKNGFKPKDGTKQQKLYDLFLQQLDKTSKSDVKEISDTGSGEKDIDTDIKINIDENFITNFESLTGVKIDRNTFPAILDVEDLLTAFTSALFNENTDWNAIQNNFGLIVNDFNNLLNGDTGAIKNIADIFDNDKFLIGYNELKKSYPEDVLKEIAIDAFRKAVVTKIIDFKKKGRSSGGVAPKTIFETELSQDFIDRFSNLVGVEFDSNNNKNINDLLLNFVNTIFDIKEDRIKEYAGISPDLLLKLIDRVVNDWDLISRAEDENIRREIIKQFDDFGFDKYYLAIDYFSQLDGLTNAEKEELIETLKDYALNALVKSLKNIEQSVREFRKIVEGNKEEVKSNEETVMGEDGKVEEPKSEGGDKKEEIKELMNNVKEIVDKYYKDKTDFEVIHEFIDDLLYFAERNIHGIGDFKKIYAIMHASFRGHRFETNLKVIANDIIEACIYTYLTREYNFWLKNNKDNFIEKIDEIIKIAEELYNNQPNLNIRSINKDLKQQFSTPIHIGVLVQLMAGVDGAHSHKKINIYEPTAGTGFLLTLADGNNIHANELDEARNYILKLILGKNSVEITNKDAVGYSPDTKQDVVVANPPFGMLKEGVDFGDGTVIKKLEYVIIIRALENLANDGRASFIIGGHLLKDLFGGEKTTVSRETQKFLYYLAKKFNIVDISEVSGELYKRQGTTYPFTVITIAGRNLDGKIQELNKDSVVQINTFDEFKNHAIEVRDNVNKKIQEIKQELERRDNEIKKEIEEAETFTAEDEKYFNEIIKGATDLSPDEILNVLRKYAMYVEDQKSFRFAHEIVNSKNEITCLIYAENNIDDANGRHYHVFHIYDIKQKKFISEGFSGNVTKNNFIDLVKNLYFGNNEMAKNLLNDIEQNNGEDIDILTDEKGYSENAHFGLVDENYFVDALIQIDINKLLEEAGDDKEKITSKLSIFETIVKRAGKYNNKELNDFISKFNKYYQKIKEDIYGKTEDVTIDDSDREINKEGSKTDGEGGDGEGNKQGDTGGSGTDVSTDIQGTSGDGKSTDIQSDTTGTGNNRDSSGVGDKETGKQDTEDSTVEGEGTGGTRVVNSDNVGVLGDDVLVEEAYQVKYEAKSKSNDGGLLVPANLAQPIKSAIENAMKELGVEDIDEYVAKELGMTKEELYNSFHSAQVDALFLAIYKIFNKKSGFIIGDMTGAGKGRVIAGIIKRANREGKIPIFVTEKPTLFNDIYRDLKDIGYKDFKPVIINKDNGEIYDLTTGKLVFEHDSELYKLLREGKYEVLKEHGYNAIFITYSQLNSAKYSDRRNLIKQLSMDNYVILDESHNAGDRNSNTGKYFRDILQNARGVLFSSATFAKRPDILDLYFRAGMDKWGFSINEIEEITNIGGDPAMEIISTRLASDGGYIRREIDFDGVKYETKILDENKELHQLLYDSVISVYYDIVELNKMHGKFVKYIAKLIEDNFGGSIFSTKAKTKEGFNPFTPLDMLNTTHNFVNQLLMSIKVEDTIKEAIASINNNERVVITLFNTQEHILREEEGSDIIDLDEISDEVDLSYKQLINKKLKDAFTINISSVDIDVAKRALNYVLGEDGYTILRTVDDNMVISVNYDKVLSKYAGKKEVSSFINELLNSRDRIIEKIKNTDFSKIPLSPIDYIKYKLNSLGIKTEEITGRNKYIDYNENKIKDRIKPKPVHVIDGFNNGDTKVLIINSSGSTGISLHASEKFKNKEKRRMLILQPLLDINAYVQALGRVNRVGQVVKPEYTVLTTALPPEMRFALFLERKMKMLNANTTAKSKSKLNLEIQDMFNRYGDEVAFEYIKEHPSLMWIMNMDNKTIEQVEASKNGLLKKLTGKIQILPTYKQEIIWGEIIRKYDEKISHAKAIGEYNLETEYHDIKAKSLVTVDIGDGVTLEGVVAKSMRRPYNSTHIISILKEKGVENIEQGHEYVKRIIDIAVEDTKKYIENMIKTAKNDDIKKYYEAQLTQLDALKNRLYEYALGKIYYISTAGGIINKGVLIDVIYKKSPNSNGLFNNDRISFVFALDRGGVPKITYQHINVSSMVTEHTGDNSIFSNSNEWDNGLGDGTVKMTIVTGNLLKGILLFNSGKLVKYTTADNKIQQGIFIKGDSSGLSEKLLTAVQGSTDEIINNLINKWDAIFTLDRNLTISYNKGKYNIEIKKWKKFISPENFVTGNVKEEDIIKFFESKGFKVKGQRLHITVKYINDLRVFIDFFSNIGVKFYTIDRDAHKISGNIDIDNVIAKFSGDEKYTPPFKENDIFLTKNGYLYSPKENIVIYVGDKYMDIVATGSKNIIPVDENFDEKAFKNKFNNAIVIDIKDVSINGFNFVFNNEAKLKLSIDIDGETKDYTVDDNYILPFVSYAKTIDKNAKFMLMYANGGFSIIAVNKENKVIGIKNVRLSQWYSLTELFEDNANKSKDVGGEYFYSLIVPIPIREIKKLAKAMWQFTKGSKDSVKKTFKLMFFKEMEDITLFEKLITIPQHSKRESIRELYNLFRETEKDKQMIFEITMSLLDADGLYYNAKKLGIYEAFRKALVALDMRSNVIVKSELKALIAKAIEEYKQTNNVDTITPEELQTIKEEVFDEYIENTDIGFVANKIIENIAKNNGLNEHQTELLKRLYANWLQTTKYTRDLILSLFEEKIQDKNKLVSIKAQMGYLKYYFPRYRDSGNWAVKVIDMNTNKVVYSKMYDLYKFHYSTEGGINLSAVKQMSIENKLRKIYPDPTRYVIQWQNTFNYNDMIGEATNPFTMDYIINQALDKLEKKYKGEPDKADMIADLENEVYGEIANLLKSKGYLSHTIRRSKHLIKGYETEKIDEVIHRFLYGVAGFVAKTRAIPNTKSALEKIPKNNFKEKAIARKYISFWLRNENVYDRLSSKVRAFMYFYTLGLKPSFLLINMTQPLMTTVPYLAHKYTWGEAVKSFVSATKIVTKYMNVITSEEERTKFVKDYINEKFDKLPPQEKFERYAITNFILSNIIPQMTNLFVGKMQSAMNSPFLNFVEKVSIPVEYTEIFNRAVSFVAYADAFVKKNGYGVLDSDKLMDLFDDATEFTLKTQFDYLKTNLPLAIQAQSQTITPMLKTAYVFRHYIVSLLNLYAEMGVLTPYTLMSLMMIALIGGAGALPFAVLFDYISQKIFKKPIYVLLKQKVGEFADYLYFGLPSLLGLNLTSQVSFNIPFVDNEFNRHVIGKDLDSTANWFMQEFFGASYGVASKLFSGVNYAIKKDFLRASEELVPLALARQLIKAYREIQEGEIVTSGYKKYITVNKDNKLSSLDFFATMLGMQTTKKARFYKMQGDIIEIKNMLNNEKMKIYAEFKRLFVRELKEDDFNKKLNEVLKKVNQYNKMVVENYPEFSKDMIIKKDSLKKLVKGKVDKTFIILEKQIK